MTTINIKESDFASLYNQDLLYKYVEWADINKRRIITELEVHFTNPDEFGLDEKHPFKIDFDKVSDEQLQKRVKEIIAQDTSFNGIYDETLIRAMIDNYRNNIKLWTIQDKEELRKYLGILSLSTRKDIPEMWTMFAEDFKGICVGLNAKELFEQSNATGGGLINYFTEAPEIPAPFLSETNDILSIFIEVLSLPSRFGKETEYRLFKLFFHGSIQRRQKIKANVYHEVIIGNAMPEKDRAELKSELNEKLPNIKIYEAKYNHSLKNVDILKYEDN